MYSLDAMSNAMMHACLLSLRTISFSGHSIPCYVILGTDDYVQTTESLNLSITVMSMSKLMGVPCSKSEFAWFLQ